MGCRGDAGVRGSQRQVVKVAEAGESTIGWKMMNDEPRLDVREVCEIEECKIYFC